MPATKKRTKKSTKPTFNVPTKDQLDLSKRENKVLVHDFEVGSSAVSMRTDYVSIVFGATEDNLHAVILPDHVTGAVKLIVGRGKENDTAFNLVMDREFTGLQINYDHEEHEFTFYSEADEEWYYVSDGIALGDQIEGADEKDADSDDDLILSTVLQQIKGHAKSVIVSAINEYNREA